MGTKLFAGCKLIGASAPNQCQITTFLRLKTDNIAKLKIELKSILLEIVVVVVVVVVVLLFYVHGKHLRSCRDGQLTFPHFFLGRLRPPKRFTSTSCPCFRQ